MAEHRILVKSRTHLTNAGDALCWCDPEYLIICPDCESEEGANCARCRDRGFVPALVPSEADLVLHNG